MLTDNLLLGQNAIIGTFDIHTPIGGVNIGGPGSAAWPVANLAFFFPFILTQPLTVKKLAWTNQATISGNVDIGIAESDGLIFTLKQTFGTGRSFPWKVLKYA